MRVCFLIPGLPAPEPVAQHARRLGERHEVVLVLTERLPPGVVAGTLPVADAAGASEPFDVAIATDWTTTAHLFRLPATRHAFWVDHLAHRRMGTWQAERLAAALAYDLPVDFLAAAPWVRDALADLRPDARCLLVTSGVGEPGSAGAAGPAAAGAAPPLRVAPSGRPDCAGAEQEVLAAMAEPAEVVHLEAADVVLMLSSVDGVLGAPLDGFRAGATAVVGPAADAADLVRHGENGLVADADDPRGAARLLDLLARDRELLARLREAARDTAAAWPSWDQAAAELEGALEQLLADPPPPQGQWPARLMGDAIGGAATVAQEIATLTAEVRRLHDDPLVGPTVRARARLKRLPAPVRRTVSGALRRLRA